MKTDKTIPASNELDIKKLSNIATYKNKLILKNEKNSAKIQEKWDKIWLNV